MLGGVTTNCFHHNAWWCRKVNSTKLNQNKIIKNELTQYNPSSRTKHMSYAVAVTSNSNSKRSDLTARLQPITNNIPQGHPDTAATGTFLAKHHSTLGTTMHHEQFGVLCANNTTMNSTTTRQLNLSPHLPAIAQQGHAFKEMDKSLVSVPVLCDAGCQVLFGEHNVHK